MKRAILPFVILVIGFYIAQQTDYMDYVILGTLSMLFVLVFSGSRKRQRKNFTPSKSKHYDLFRTHDIISVSYVHQEVVTRRILDEKAKADVAKVLKFDAPSFKVSEEVPDPSLFGCFPEMDLEFDHHLPIHCEDQKWYSLYTDFFRGTAGCVVKVGKRRYALTAAHTFSFSENPGGALDYNDRARLGYSCIPPNFLGDCTTYGAISNGLYQYDTLDWCCIEVEGLCNFREAQDADVNTLFRSETPEQVMDGVVLEENEVYLISGMTKRRLRGHIISPKKEHQTQRFGDWVSIQVEFFGGFPVEGDSGSPLIHTQSDRVIGILRGGGENFNGRKFAY